MNCNTGQEQKNYSPHEKIARIQRFITPIPEALEELKIRQKDPALKMKVEQFLNGDIPEHFKNGPVLYLSRHVATPSYATLRFVELCKPNNLPIVIGEDKNDLFVSQTSLKRSLAKLPIVKGVSRNSDEIIEFFTILNFSEAQGKQFKDLKTLFNTNFIDFHTKLFRSIYPDEVEIVDESNWIDRQHRGDLRIHYRKLLALLLRHGIMFEYYEAEDCPFVDEVLAPAYSFIEQEFGYKPLICNLVDPEIENLRDWNSYPSVIYKMVKNSLESKIQ